MEWPKYKAEAIENYLKNVFNHMSPKYTVTCTGKVMAITEDILTDDIIDNLDIGRTDAFNGSDYVCIDKITVNTIADILENMDDSEWTPAQKEAAEIFFDAVNCIQYQLMIKWLNEYQNSHKEENK